MKKLTLLRYNYSKFGGAERYLERIITYLSNNGWNLKVLSAKSGYINSELVNIPRYLPSFLKPLFFSKKACEIKKSDELYFSLERVSCCDIYRAGDGVHASWLLRKRAKYRFFRRLLSYCNLKDYIFLYLEKQTFKNSKKIIANSELVKKEIEAIYNIDPKKIVVVHNGVDIKNSTQSQEEAREALGVRDELVFLYVGNGFFRKGVEEALEILSKAKDREFVFLVVGGDKKMEWYKNKAKNLGLERKVRFVGEQSDPSLYYMASDIFLFPTLYDPFSNATLEAMAYGNMLLTTKNNGVSELLEDTQIIDVDSDISYLFDNRELIEELKNKNIELAKTLTIESNVLKTLEVIKSVS